MREGSKVYVVKYEDETLSDARYVAYKPDGSIDKDYELPTGTGFLLLPDEKTVLDVCGREWPLKIISKDDKGEINMENQISINSVLDNIERAVPSNEEVDAFHDGMKAGVSLGEDIKNGLNDPDKQGIDERLLGQEYINAAHNPVRDYARRNAVANYNKNYRRPGTSFNNKRFMDCSYDNYNVPLDGPVMMPNTYGLYSSFNNPAMCGCGDIELAEKRLAMIKDSISVTEWDILNATNFTSPIDQIKRYIEIIDKLGKAGVFDPIDSEN